MEFTHTRLNGIELVEVAGKLDFASSVEFDERLRAIVETPGQRFIALDLANVSALSSPSLRAILALAKRIVRVDGRVVVARPSEVALECFKISGFLKLNIFTVENTVEAAVEKLKVMAANATALPEKPAAPPPPQANAPAPVARGNPLLGGVSPSPAAPAETAPPARVNPLLGGTVEKPASPTPKPAPASSNPLLGGGSGGGSPKPSNPLLAASPSAAPVPKPEPKPTPPPAPASSNPLLGGGSGGGSPKPSNPLLAAVQNTAPAPKTAAKPADPQAARAASGPPPLPSATPASAAVPVASSVPKTSAVPPAAAQTDSSEDSAEALGLKETIDYWMGKIGLKKSATDTVDAGTSSGNGPEQNPLGESATASDQVQGGIGQEIKAALGYWLGRFKGKG